MIDIKNKKNCCGCSACANICPKNCISMVSDEEGFLYPHINKDVCVDCGMCEKVCPEVTPISFYDRNTAKLYLIQNKNDKERSESTSGGFFTPLAEYVINQGGVVFGASFKDYIDFYVEHTYTDKIDELYKFRGSKYVQSDPKTCYKAAKKFLDDGRLVCYSGTPCQIQGLIKYLQKEYVNLITVDVVCRAVPSPLIWKKYVEYQKNRFGQNFDYIKFRDKCYGYSYSTMSVYSKNKSKKKDYHCGIESDRFLRSFFSGINIRPACIKCTYKGLENISDFTVWDCFTVGKLCKKMDDNKGTTRVLLQSDKAVKIFEKIKSRYVFEQIKNADKNKGGKDKAYSENIDIDRNRFYKDANDMDCIYFWDKYFPMTFKILVLQYGRLFTYKTGIYKFVKKIWDVIKNR